MQHAKQVALLSVKTPSVDHDIIKCHPSTGDRIVGKNSLSDLIPSESPLINDNNKCVDGIMPSSCHEFVWRASVTNSQKRLRVGTMMEKLNTKPWA